MQLQKGHSFIHQSWGLININNINTPLEIKKKGKDKKNKEKIGYIKNTTTTYKHTQRKKLKWDTKIHPYTQIKHRHKMRNVQISTIQQPSNSPQIQWPSKELEKRFLKGPS